MNPTKELTEMTAQKLTNSPTEADLEAEIHQAIAKAFRWLSPESIRHQTKFSFKFGHKKIEIDGKEVSRAEARSDIILYHEERPLAVLELKRSGVPLLPADDAQGLSYARVLIPSPPLVVVTNGSEIRFIETYSGKLWTPAQESEEAFKALLTSTAQVAARDLRLAIDTLMGTNAAVWMQAVRHATQDTLGELTASADHPALPFAKNLLLPRRSTAHLLQEVLRGKKLILLTGAPLSGKSNILREVSLRTEEHEAVATLYVEGGVGQGILRSLADALTRSVAWPITPEEARAWLTRVSQNGERKLVLAIDGLDPTDEEGRREIEDLTANTFGPGLCLVVALDDGVAERLSLAPNRLTPSVIGRRGVEVPLGELDDKEFEIAQQVLIEQQVSFRPGAAFAREYRQPWVLRGAIEPVLDDAKSAASNVLAALPPLLGVDLIRQTRERFTDPELRRMFRALAKTVLAEAKDANRDQSLILESLDVNIVRRVALTHNLEAVECTRLIDSGFLRAAVHGSGEPVVYIRMPELLASELAKLLADDLIPLIRENPIHAAAWLSGAASNLPIGDVIAAQAVYDAVKRPGGISFAFIAALLETPPKRTQLPAGTQFAMNMPGVGMIDLTLQGNGIAIVELEGEVHTLEVDDDGIAEVTSYENLYPWLILSHLAGQSFVMDKSGTQERVDPLILIQVGSAEIPLRKPGGTTEMDAMPTHDIPSVGSIVCHEAGVVEPITYSIFRFLARESAADADAWVNVAVSMDSMPLLSRVHIALLELSRSADVRTASWARATLDEKVLPAFNLLPLLHEPGSTDA
ncbi:hypothetical protein [Paraburkholderia heleia]|uniref:hypothetical protein n=1 Tax=Paraburkholderia heleia TaxID=634127 RepID=UPI0031D7126F